MTDLRTDGAAALEWAASYLERVGELPVLAQVKPGEIRARLPASAPDEPEPFSAILRDLDEVLMPGMTHWQHPRYFAYFATSSSEPAILAELLAATLNSVAILWRTAPASTELEGVVLDWTAELLGLPAGWHGHIEDTASTSTLAAVIAAREATGRDLIVCSDQAHSAADKAARMLGMRLRKVPSDGEFRLDVEAMGDLRDAAVVIATVGTTATTSVDPVPAIADACERDGAWLHVDAAYAGAAMVCPEHRWAFAGVDRADSVVVNAHKWMLTPVDCSLLWTRRPQDFRQAFSVIPEFLRTPDAEDAWSLSEYGPALGRRFRALKLWAVLRCHGRSGLQAHVRGGIELAQKFERWVAAEPGWELCAPRHFSDGLLPRRWRRPAKRAAAGAGQRQRRAVHLARRPGRALRAAPGDRADEHDRGRRAPGLGRAATRGRRPVIAAVPIPQVPAPPAVPAYIGAPAPARPVRGVPPTPRNPFMAPNGTSEIHGDAWQTDAYSWSGPAGRSPATFSTLLHRDCGTIAFDRRGRLVSICVGLDGPRLFMFDPATLATLATFALPPRQGAPGNLFQDFSAGGYFYLDDRDRVVTGTTTRHVYVIAERAGGPGFRLARDYDLSARLAPARSSPRRSPTGAGCCGSWPGATE